jgi:ribosomal protein L16 Arg81 hydroxylase
MIEDFGGRIATVWSELRPTTRGLLERALQPANVAAPQARSIPYDSRADLELSRFLAALDDRVSQADASLDREKSDWLRRIADTCAAMLQEKTQSAEVFAQLVQRAGVQRDYRRIDALADALTLRFAPSEICELARSQDVIVRALANEALAQFPTTVLLGLLSDPVDSEIARDALQRQAIDYGSEEARQIVNALDQVDITGEDL